MTTDNGLRVTGTLVAIGPSPSGPPYWAIWIATRPKHTILLSSRDEASARAVVGGARIGDNVTLDVYAYPLNKGGYLLFPDDFDYGRATGWREAGTVR